MVPVGRFAPSPTGPLHFGSLVAALASWLDARAAGGRWLLRIEDLDPPREQPGAADLIQRQLEAFGLFWDGPVLYQSQRAAQYRAALERLSRDGLAYACACSRREIADSALGTAADGAAIYPGTCRAGLAANRAARSLRFRATDEVVRFEDRVQGAVAQSVGRDVGDFILRRADGFAAYQLAVVVDDAAQGVTDVVRGADLLASTPRQILLQHALGLPTPRYAHVPAIVDAAGAKLAKQNGAIAFDAHADAPQTARNTAAVLGRALACLGHTPPPLPADEMLAWARSCWDIARVPRTRTLRAVADA
ncbi:MAG: tRNA glutamyl-Q(34) synthetase GluQRS [Proteobacteria bacterium]|nr:tRNA glutamyl-Q(34) synthetase GluQRS [Pseudomonadota bacterium]